MTSLLQLFNNRYQFPNLVVAREEFMDRLSGYLAQMDESRWMPARPGGLQWDSFLETASWGHNHDFGGGLVVRGRMEDRHIRIAERFVNLGALPEDLTGLKALVTGCYTGGDALLLSAMGAEVTATENHLLYAEISRFLAESFGMKVKIADVPLAWNKGFLWPYVLEAKFNLVYCSGVLYHLEDPLGALGEILEALEPGGKLLVESMVTEQYQGAWLSYHGRGVSGYNWFVPSPLALVRMMADKGFIGAKHLLTEDGRGYFAAQAGTEIANEPCSRASIAASCGQSGR